MFILLSGSLIAFFNVVLYVQYNSLCFCSVQWGKHHLYYSQQSAVSRPRPGGKSLIIQDLRHLYQYSTKYVAHIPSRQCTFLKGYLVQTYSRFVYIYPSSAGVSILKDIGCIHTRNMHQYTLL